MKTAYSNEIGGFLCGEYLEEFRETPKYVYHRLEDFKHLLNSLQNFEGLTSSLFPFL